MENSGYDKLAIVEALIFASNKGLEINQIADFADCSKSETLSIMEELKEIYESERHGVELKKVGKKFGFYTKKKYAENVSRLVRRPVEKLTSSQIEVLAIVAKNGPVKKSQIELIRGKSSDNQVIELMLAGLLKRKRVKGPGRPYAYYVTDGFYEVFHIADFEVPRVGDQSEDDEIPETTQLETEKSDEVSESEIKENEEEIVNSENEKHINEEENQNESDLENIEESSDTEMKVTEESSDLEDQKDEMEREENSIQNSLEVEKDEEEHEDMISEQNPT